MKTLVAITTCKLRRTWANSQRQTWIKDSSVDVRFFIGDNSLDEAKEDGDVVLLPCRDDYQHLPIKVQLAAYWALLNGYDYMFKCDDDVYLRPERLSGINGDYVGRYQEPRHGVPGGFCFGFFYGLSKKALGKIVQAKPPDVTAEDVWVANTLYKSGIVGQHDSRFIMTGGKSQHLMLDTPKAFNDIIAVAEYKDMNEPHNVWLRSLEEWDKVTKNVLSEWDSTNALLI